MYFVNSKSWARLNAFCYFHFQSFPGNGNLMPGCKSLGGACTSDPAKTCPSAKDRWKAKGELTSSSTFDLSSLRLWLCGWWVLKAPQQKQVQHWLTTWMFSSLISTWHVNRTLIRVECQAALVNKCIIILVF